MKYILIAIIAKNLVISPPLAAGLSAEFDDEPACEKAAAILRKHVAKLNTTADSLIVCAPKSSG